MADTPEDIAALIAEAGETASSHLFHAVQKRCLDLLRDTDRDAVLLFTVGMLAGAAADRLEAGEPLESTAAHGWRTLAGGLADALRSRSASDAETCIRLLYPPRRSH